MVLLCGVSVLLSRLSYPARAELGQTAFNIYAKYRLKPLDYSAVKLHGDLKRQFDEVCNYYYNIPNDNLLKPFRERAGLAAPGKDMGGVYITHCPFGQFLSGYARMYAATKDEKYRKKAVTLMEEWAQTIEPDGFFFQTRNPFLSAYYYEKIMGGLLDIYYYCGDANALKYLDKITSWAEKNSPRTRIYCDVVGQGTGEWYTQSENLYRAYLYTGEQRHKDFAEVWEYTEFWDKILSGDYEKMYKESKWLHAYSHVNSFNGLAGAYLVKGDGKYLDTLKKAYDFLQDQQCYATGGFGPDEQLLPRKALKDALRMVEKSFETQCGCWAGFKMTKYLVGLTGDAKYTDWTEKLIINGIGASIPMTEKGEVFYLSCYMTIGAEKKNFVGAAWPCCSGTRAEAVPDYHNLLYFYDDNSIYVAQYFASEASFRIGGSSVKIIQDTKFPQEDTTKLIVHIDKPARFDIKFRIPDWLADKAGAEVNGKVYDYQVDKNWGIISNNWTDGDVITLKLPMKLEASQFVDNQEYPAAIMYGPVALAVKCEGKIGNPARLINLEHLSNDFIRAENEPLIWKLRGHDSVILKPFYAYKEGERYFLYLDKNAPQILPVPAGSQEISVTLTNPQKSKGLLLRESDGESQNEPVVKDGREAWMATKPLGNNHYIYYQVLFPEFRQGRAAKIGITVDYFDEGLGDFRIVYDSSDTSVQVAANHPGAWKEAGRFKLTDTKTWNTYKCSVDDAKFAGRCNGADIRFEITSGSVRPAIGRVKLTRQPVNEPQK